MTEPNPCVPVKWQDTCHLYGLWAWFNLCRAECFYCFSKANHRKFKPRGGPDEMAVQAWRNIYARYGPNYMLCTGMEPTEELPLVAEMLKWHYASIQTNMMFKVEDLLEWVPVERVNLHPTFHPHLWKGDITPFLEKLDAVRGHGYDVVLVATVGVPQYLEKWDEWRERIQERGIYWNAAPMRTELYPEFYTDEQLEVVVRHIPEMLYTEKAPKPPLRATACAAGHATYTVLWSGDVTRCGELPGGMGNQNIYANPEIEMLSGPLPCGAEVCSCGNMFPYHIYEEALVE